MACACAIKDTVYFCHRYIVVHIPQLIIYDVLQSVISYIDFISTCVTACANLNNDDPSTSYYMYRAATCIYNSL